MGGHRRSTEAEIDRYRRAGRKARTSSKARPHRLPNPSRRREGRRATVHEDDLIGKVFAAGALGLEYDDEEMSLDAFDDSEVEEHATPPPRQNFPSPISPSPL